MPLKFPLSVSCRVLLGSGKTSCWGFLAKSSLLSLPPTHHPPLAPGRPRHHCLVICNVLVIVDSLEMRISDEFCTSFVSDQPTHTMIRLLVRVVSTSQVWLTRSIQIFAKYLMNFDWNSNLIYIYLSFVSSVLNSAPDQILLYPNTYQSLVSLRLTHRDINKLGMGVQVVRDMFNLKDFDVTMVLL